MTTAVETKTFAGLPIAGMPEHGYRKSITQITHEQFESLLVAALNAEGVEAITWTQYTPYFNDGDVCEFSASMYDDYNSGVNLTGFSVGRIGISDERLVGGQRNRYTGYDHTTHSNKYEDFGPVYEPHPARDAVLALASVINNGSAYGVLLDVFGDHAQITVTKQGISIEGYEHE